MSHMGLAGLLFWHVAICLAAPWRTALGGISSDGKPDAHNFNNAYFARKPNFKFVNSYLIEVPHLSLFTIERPCSAEARQDNEMDFHYA